MVQSSSQVQESHDRYWWSSYGTFPPADAQATRPHAGRVIAHYRKLRGWKAEQLASTLGVKRSQMFGIEQNPELPKVVSRRELLASALNIPPVLMGLASVETVMSQPVIKASTLPSTTSQAYESVLELAWTAYYSSSAQQAAGTVSHFLTLLENERGTASGVARDQLGALLCRFYQLSGVAARDRLDFYMAISQGSQALDIAIALRNAELITSSLFRRARTYIEMGRAEMAVRDLEQAKDNAERSRDPQRCYALLCLAEAYSIATPHDSQKRQESLLLLDRVGRTVRTHGVLAGDGSFTKVDAPGLHMIRGDILRRFGMLDEASNALLIARDHLPRHFVRWQGNLLVSEAQLCYAEKDVDGACELSLDALSILDETRSSSTKAKLERLHARMERIAPLSSSVKELGQRLQK